METELTYSSQLKCVPPSWTWEVSDQFTDPNTSSLSDQSPLLSKLEYPSVSLPFTPLSVSPAEQAFQISSISSDYIVSIPSNFGSSTQLNYMPSTSAIYVPYSFTREPLKQSFDEWYLCQAEAWNQEPYVVKSNDPPNNINFSTLSMINSKRSMIYQCDICSKVFDRKYVLKRHRGAHTSEKDYHCQPCHMSFYRKDIFDRHLTTKKCTKAHKIIYGASYTLPIASYQRSKPKKQTF